jgi:hypothetical protein
MRIAANQQILITGTAASADDLIYGSISVGTPQAAVSPDGNLFIFLFLLFISFPGFLCMRQAMPNHYMKMVVLDSQNTTAYDMGPVTFNSLPNVNVSVCLFLQEY